VTADPAAGHGSTVSADGLVPHRQALARLAAALIAASLVAGALAIATRSAHAGGDVVRGCEGVTLFLAAAAYLAYAFAHHRNRRGLLTRSVLVSAFALWGIVRLAPGFGGAGVLGDARSSSSSPIWRAC